MLSNSELSSITSDFEQSFSSYTTRARRILQENKRLSLILYFQYLGDRSKKEKDLTQSIEKQVGIKTTTYYYYLNAHDLPSRGLTMNFPEREKFILMAHFLNIKSYSIEEIAIKNDISIPEYLDCLVKYKFLYKKGA